MNTLKTRLRQALQAMQLVWASAAGWTLLQGGSMVLQGILPVASLFLTRQVVNALSAFLLHPPDGRDPSELLVWVPWVAALGLIAWICRAASSLFAEAQAGAVSNYVLQALQKKSTEVDLACFEMPAYYDQMRLAQTEALTRPTSIVRNLTQMGIGLFVLISVAGVLWMTQGFLLPILLLAALPGALARVWSSRRWNQWRIAHSARERYAGYLHVLLSALPFAKEIRLSGNGPELRRQSADMRSRLRQSRLRLQLYRTGVEMAADGLSALAILCGAVVMYLRLSSSTMTLGDLALLYGGFQRGKSAFSTVLRSLASLYEDSLFLTHFYTFLGLPQQVRSPANPKPLPERLEQGIQLDQVSFRYPGTDRDVLQSVSLTIRPGEHIALVGENGSGKTTLVKLLCRLYDPTEGRILIDGTDIREFDLAELRKAFSVLFQDYVRYQMTAGENVRMGNVECPAGDSRIEEAAREAGSDALIERLPQGYDTMLGRLFEGGMELSEGQWQRVALARTFMRKAPIVILDEPTSSLDAKAERELLESFMEIVPGRTALVISHRYSTVQAADRIVLLSEGRVVESGSHEQLVEAGGAYSDLFALHAR